MAIKAKSDDHGLGKLGRPELQKLAKEHHIRGNLKSMDIINALVDKGVWNEKLFPRASEPQYEPQTASEDPYGGLQYPDSSEPEVDPPVLPDAQLTAEQFHGKVSERIERNLRLPSPGLSPSASVSVALPSSPPRFQEPSPVPDHRRQGSASNQHVHMYAQELEIDSMDLEDYEVAMGEPEAQEHVAPLAHHNVQPVPVFNAQRFVATPAQMHQQYQRHTPPAVGPSQPIEYTPNGKHVYTNDSKRPIAPRCFYNPNDPNRPSACHRPPFRKTARRYLRECVGYIDEQQKLRVQMRDINGIHAIAKQKLAIAQGRLARIQKARVAIEKHWMQMLKADARLHEGSWSWTRPETAEQETVPLPEGPPKWSADEYSDLDDPDEDFEITEEGEGHRKEKHKIVKHSEAQEAHLERVMNRFEAWMYQS